VKQVAKVQLDKLKNMPDHLDDPEEHALLEAAHGKVRVFDFGGPLSFGAAADVGHHVREKVKNSAHVLILDFERVPFMDVSAARAVETIAVDAKAAGKVLYVSGLGKEVEDVLKGLGVNESYDDSSIFETRLDALKSAAKVISENNINVKKDEQAEIGQAQPAV
jgi:SulP family sulfate permease